MSSSQESKDKCSKFPVHLVIDFLVPQLLTVRKCVTELPNFSCYFGKKKEKLLLGLKLFTVFPLWSCQFLKLCFNIITTQKCQKILLFLKNKFRSLCYYRWHFTQPHLLLQVLHLNTLRTGGRSFKLFKRPLPGFLTILTL